MKNPDGELADSISIALGRLRQMPPAKAVISAAQVSLALSQAASDAALIRAQAVAKIREERNLSLGQLAQELNISRARAAQLVRAAHKDL